MPTPFNRLIVFAVATTIASSIAAQTEPQTHQIANPTPPTGEWKKTTYQISKVDAAPKIDGKLDEACWQKALHADGFYRFRSNDPVKEQTEAWICADRNHLYLAFHCKDSHLELIKANETQREGNLEHDDYVGIAIDTQGNRRNVSQFTVNARGTQLTQVEGGTAENITWAGDWTAATQRVADGWTCEISIPFGLMRYPRGAKNFPLALIRQIPRETNAEIWPYIPMGSGDVNPLQYLNDFVGVEPPYYAPHIVFLPYTLATTGKTTDLREGLDIKYPISTTLTGVATIFPDFATVEQAVQDLSFSYTEKFIPDHRPFFAEGSQYWQDSFLYYSQRIANVDAGAQVVGKQGATTIGLLGTTARDSNGQSSLVSRFSHDLGAYSQVGGAFLANSMDGLPSNRVAQVNGQYGWMHGGRQVTLMGNTTRSWLSDGRAGDNQWVQLMSDAGRNKVRAQVYYSDTTAAFTNQLGLVSETDLRGEGFTLSRNGAHDKGPIERDYFGINGSTYDHHAGGFFHDSLSVNNYISLRNGWDFQLDGDIGKREDFHDNTVSGTVAWNQKTLFQRGSGNYQVGRRENMPYQFFAVNQGWLLSKGFSVQGMYNQIALGDFHDSQTIVSGNYRLNPSETFGGRLVQHDGKLNLYLSYGRRTHHGTDIFFLIGDPNSPNTRGVFTVKLVRPF